MGLTEDFETSLQVLRGFEADITNEVNEIKVNCMKDHIKQALLPHMKFGIKLVVKFVFILCYFCV